MTENTMREAFELKISMEYEQSPSIERDGDGYMDGYVDNAWWGWQAAIAHQNQDALSIYQIEGVNWADVSKEQYEVWKKQYPHRIVFLAPPQPQTVKDALDAERWRYFVETCSSEAGFELTGITDASNDEINAAIDAAIREVK